MCMHRAFRWCVLLAIPFMALSINELAACTQMQTLNQLLKCELDRFRTQYGFPGVTVAYVLSDGTVGEVAIGLADIESRELMTTQSRMLAASIGKTFVAATVVALAKENRLGSAQNLVLHSRTSALHLPLPTGD